MKRGPKQALPVARAAARDLRDQGYGLKAIGEELARLGYLSPSGKPYLAESVKHMLPPNYPASAYKVAQQRQERIARELAERLHCSFCGKAAAEVPQLIRAPKACICNECVARCMAILIGPKAA